MNEQVELDLSKLSLKERIEAVIPDVKSRADVYREIPPHKLAGGSWASVRKGLVRKRETIPRYLATLLTVVISSGPTGAAEISPSVQRGQSLAQANCSRCHAIDKVSPSPLEVAPPFRTLHLRYPVESLEEALGEGIVTGHPVMPEFRLDPAQISDFIAFLKSLEE
jgi:cytochrome c